MPKVLSVVTLAPPANVNITKAFVQPETYIDVPALADKVMECGHTEEEKACGMWGNFRYCILQ